MIEYVIALFDFQNFLTKFPVGKVKYLTFYRAFRIRDNR